MQSNIYHRMAYEIYERHLFHSNAQIELIRMKKVYI